MILTYKYRVKDRATATRRALRKQASAVNYVWNFCAETDRAAAASWRSGRNVRRPTAFDLTKLCRGVTAELGIHSDTIDAICKKFVDSRSRCFPKTPRFRSYKRTLPWIPFSNFNRPAKLDSGRLTVMKRCYRLWYSRPLPPGASCKSWCFSTDARGRWYVNIQVELPEARKREITSEVGIDLGLKSLATLSSGDKIEMPSFYRRSEDKLAQFQRRGQKSRARALAIKVANQRKHFLHIISSHLVKKYDKIIIGDVSSSKLSKTRMAKSVHDAGWSMLRSMLQYKSIATGATCEIVSEHYSTQMCSSCGNIPDNSPKGMGTLGMRQWTCCECGTLHDRDVNAAINILNAGAERRPLAEGIPKVICGNALTPEQGYLSA